MTESNDNGLRPIRRALISVSDKTGIIEFARALQEFKVEIISTGGTAKALRDAGLDVRDISDVTGFPEMMDGRVKTLHPRIHGGLLALRENPEHVDAMKQHSIEPIDMVVVNLYPFQETVQRPGVTREEAIEQIDIGGPSMIRSAAKNAQSVAVVVSPQSYNSVLTELKENNGSLSLETRNQLAVEAFAQTSNYDQFIFAYLSGALKEEQEIANAAGACGGFTSTSFTVTEVEKSGGTESIEAPSNEELNRPPDYVSFIISKSQDLRYGENPHQLAALYATGESGLASAELLSGKEMSFNNYVDADAAWQLVCDFEETACAIIKHTNPAGVGIAETPSEAYRRALATDPVSAFGGIVAFNRNVDEAAALVVTKIFTEVITAPDYDPAALEVLRAKKNLRVIKMDSVKRAAGLEFRQIGAGVLVQTKDDHQLRRDALKVVTKRAPTDEEVRALLFAWTVCKHTKSNAIVYARENQTVGVGAGQMSRVDSVKIGAMRAQLPVAGSVLASDAFFPFRDGIDEAAKFRITAVIQPGGSVRDDEVIAAADEHGLAMVFTGIRHFKH
jgi:phosphoribosylaminoimidazolecarboxamide formyltransferase/IMP cyclohydrolase